MGRNYRMDERKIFDLLKEKAREGKLPPSIILITQNPEGGLEEAREIARQSFCLKEAEENCSCLMCHHLKNTSHPDYFEIMAAKNQILIDQIRELREEAQKPPYEARCRFFVLIKAHQLNVSASNAFLKILEEPPSTAYFILLTSQPNLLLPTIRSRCLSFPTYFKEIKNEIPENIISSFEEFILNPNIVNLYIFIENLSKEPLHLIPLYLLNLNLPKTPPFLVDISFEFMDILVKYPSTFNPKLLLEALFLPRWHQNFYKKLNF